MLANIFTILADDKPLWVEMVGMLIPIGLAVWGAIRAFRAWEKQKKREIDLLLEQQRYERKLDACQGVWPLLAYMSNKENDKTIYVKRSDNKWYLRKKQGQEFLQQLPEVFYAQAHGVFIPSEAKKALFYFRIMVYSILQKSADTDADLVLLEKQDYPVTTGPEYYETVRSSLKKMLTDSRIEFQD